MSFMHIVVKPDNDGSDDSDIVMVIQMITHAFGVEKLIIINS